MTDEALPSLPPAVATKGFELKEKIASGGFSSVYRATWTQKPGVDIAAKIINLGEVNQAWVLKNLKNEMKILRRLNHPNVIHVYEMVKTTRFAYIFMQFAKNGCVKDLLIKNERPIPEPMAKKYMKDIATGLAYVHSEGVAHRDIKPDNFLIDHNNKVLLSDFGFACITISKDDPKLMKGTGCGSAGYMAIEIKLNKEGEVYDAKATDLYSLGISLYEMVYGGFPFPPNEVECIRKQKNKEYKHRSSINTSDSLKNLIDKLLDPNPKTRITSAQVLEHPWIRGSTTS